MPFLRKNILKAGFIVFAFLFFGSFSQNASAAAGDVCTSSGGGAPETGTCQPVASCPNSATMHVTVAPNCNGTVATGNLFCCIGTVAAAATSCTGLGGVCVSTNSSSCGTLISGATTGCFFGSPNNEVCCVASTISSGGSAASTTVTPTASTTVTPTASTTVTPTASSQSIEFKNPLGFDTVEEVLGSLLSTLQGIIVILSLVFIVIGAVLYITSAGDEGRMKTAKGAILASMIGLAIGLAAPSFLKEIGTVLGWQTGTGGTVDDSAVAGALTLTQIATNVLNFLLSVVGVLAIIMLVVGGIMYLTAAGDEDRIDSGKKIVKYSIIGIFVALAALVMVSQIATFFV